MADLTMGAVAYDPKVVTIWEGFVDWLALRGFDLDVVLYRTYERQVAGHAAGEVDVAWNSPLAFLLADRVAAARGGFVSGFAMRDTDRDLSSVIVVEEGSPFQSLRDLHGHRVAVGAHDSPQATLIPLGMLHESGVVANRDVEVTAFDVMPGKHGDHVGGERDAARALCSGAVQAACLIDANLVAFGHDGTWGDTAVRVLARTPTYDHCMFTAFDGKKEDRVEVFRDHLLSMSFDDPVCRPLLQMEGLREWRRGRVGGMSQLARAIDALDTPGAVAARQFVANLS